MAATADLYNVIPSRLENAIPYTCGSTTVIYKGTLVGTIVSTGLLAPMQDAVAQVFVGRASEGVNQGGITGTTSCRVDASTSDRYLDIPANTPLQVWVGADAFAVDDTTVALADTTTLDNKVGKIVAIVATGASGKVTVDTLR